MKDWVRWYSLVTVLLFPILASGQTKIFYFQIKEDIGPATNHLVELALQEAKEKQAEIVILEIDTYGGTLNDAISISQQLMRFSMPVWAFVNNKAFSAGALISLSCDSIYMAPASTMGAATVVMQDPQGGMQYAPEKIQSSMRGIMRSVAQTNGRDTLLAQRMVDENLEDTVHFFHPGKLITFTTQEAIRFGFCEGQVNSVEEIIAKNKIKQPELIRYQLSTVNKIIRFFMNPVVSGILILLIIGGIYYELQSPGVGFPLIIALTALVLYFVPYYLNGLAENWELLVLFAGMALLGLEIFVIPGFKITGILGLALIFISLGLMMIGNDGLNFSGVPLKNIYSAVVVSGLGLIGSFGLIAVLAPTLAKSKKFSHIALQTSLDSKQGYTSSTIVNLIGQIGITHTVLRPSGKILIEQRLYDASTRGDYLDKGIEVVVIAQEGGDLIVKPKAC